MSSLSSTVHAFLLDSGLNKTAKNMQKESKDTLESKVSPTLLEIVAKHGPKKRARSSSSSSSTSSSSSSSSSDSDSDSDDDKQEAPPAKKSKKDTTTKPDPRSTKTQRDTGFSASADVEANKYRKKHAMKLDSDVDFSPYRTFDVVHQHLPKHLINSACQDSKGKLFEAPTPIQAQAWPVLCAERDVIGIAETGSGKTLAFLLPAIARFGRKEQKRGDAPTMLVVAPTRELAMQTADVADKLPNSLVRSLCVYGGVPKYTQKKALRNGIDLLVATPGRLLDLCSELIYSTPDGGLLTDVNFICLDEADRMLDQGFEQEMRKVVAMIGKSPKNGGIRQTALFSATWPEIIRKLAREFLDRPVRITIGSDDLTGTFGMKNV